jgi:hypothetical protein
MKKDRQDVKPRSRVLIVIPILLVALWAAIWGGASALTPRLSSTALARMMEVFEKLGIGLEDLSFKTSRVSPLLNRIELGGVSTRFDLDLRDKTRLQSTMDTQAAEVDLGNPFNLRGSVRLSGLEIRLDASDLPSSLPFDHFANAQLSIENLSLMRPRQTAQDLRRKLKALFLENEAVGDVKFSGDVKLTVDEVELTAHLFTEQNGDRFRLRFRKSDIQELSDRKNMGLAPEQIKIISYYPLRAPVIMSATDRARDLARQHEPNDVWLRDAHRHVTWSFLLTQHFGPDFATRVTNAHEKRQGNTPNERAMDYHNNAIGRRLFADGVALDTLAQRVRKDPDIIRHPDEVDAFGEERLLR